MASNYPNSLDGDDELFQVAEGDSIEETHHNSLKNAIKAMQRASRHDTDATVYVDGNDYVAVDEDGVEVSRDTSLSTVLQGAADEAGSGTVLLKSGSYGSLSTTVTGSALFIINGPDVSISGTSNLPKTVSISEENSGTETQSGDGATTTFTIPHGLASTPNLGDVDVTAASADAAGDFYISNTTSTDIEITYASAPTSGTDNLKWSFGAKA